MSAATPSITHSGRVWCSMNDDSAARWIQISEGDLSRALNCNAASDILGACYNSQQTIETAIKAALVFEDMEFPHVHDLWRL